MFQLILTDFEDLAGQLKTTFRFEFHQPVFKKVTWTGLNNLRQKKYYNSTWVFMILSKKLSFQNTKISDIGPQTIDFKNLNDSVVIFQA